MPQSQENASIIQKYTWTTSVPLWDSSWINIHVTPYLLLKNVFHTAQCKKPEITNVAESTKYENYYNANDSVEVKCKEGYGASHEKMTCTEGSKWNQTSQCIGEQMSNFPLLPPNVTPKMSNTDTYRTSLTPWITHKEAVQICLLCIPN